MNDIDRISLHFKYCVLILTMMLIAVATDRWTAQKDFTTYLSNAATMTSLVLGLVAIFYSYISNDGLSKSLGSIATVSADVRDSKAEIARYVDLTKDVVTKTQENTLLFTNASNEVNSSLITLDTTLKEISEQNQKLESFLSAIPTRMDQLESKMGDVAKAIGEKPNVPYIAATNADIPPRVIDRFLARPSLEYNLVTYALVLSERLDKPVSMERLSEALETKQMNTMSGFVLAMHSLQLLSLSVYEKQDRVYKITDIHPELKTKTKKYIDKYINDSYAARPKIMEAWFKKIRNVEALFD